MSRPRSGREADTRRPTHVIVSVRTSPGRAGDGRSISWRSDAMPADLFGFDSVARLRVQVAVLWLGGEDEVDVLLDWTDAKDFTAPVVKARGRTPLGKAVRLALSKIEDQKGRYNQSGVAYNRPWVFVITDGEPTDHDWEQAAAECQQAEQARKAVVYGVAVGEGNLEKLARFCNPERRPLRLQGLEFKKLFVWLSRSTSSASRETPGQTKELAPITWSAPT